MAWESREGSNRKYYTRSRWVNGKVKREYVRRDIAHLIAELDAMERLEREQEAQEQRRERAERDAYYRDVFAPLDALDAQCQAAIHAEMTAAGYYLHKRGEWRKRRER